MKRRILDGDFLDRLDAAALVLKTPMTGFFGGGRKARSYGNTVEFADFRDIIVVRQGVQRYRGRGVPNDDRRSNSGNNEQQPDK